MRVGIMQPYFFPYIGYWQLLNAVDTYVIFDDVNFINRGWIHRNRILINGEPAYINVPMLEASQNKKICEIKVNEDEKLKKTNLNKIQSAYGRAPFFKEVFPVISDAIQYKSENLADYNTHAIRAVCHYLSIDTKIIMSSEINKDNSLKAQDKILDICIRLGANEYINAIGGRELYKHAAFDDAGIKLLFLKTGDIRYDQFGGDFVSNLSLIDVMMFSSCHKIREMLGEFSLVD